MANSAFRPVYNTPDTSLRSNSVKIEIVQANSFVTNDVVYHNGATFEKATASSFATSAVVGIVEAATAAGFTLVVSGRYEGTGLTAGAIHYLSPSVAGALTTTEPSTISVPVLYGISSTEGIVLIDQPESTGQSYAVDSGAADAYVVTLAPVPPAYITGMKVYVKITNTNTGPSTINVNSLGVKNIFYRGSGTIAAGALRSGSVVGLVYDGTQFHILSNEINDGTVTSITADNGVETVSGSAITVTGALRGKVGYREVSGASDTLLNTDRAKVVSYTSASNVAVALPQANAASEFLTAWFVFIKNAGTAVVTITPATSTIDGGTILNLQPGQSCMIISQGGNYTSYSSISGSRSIKRLAANNVVSSTTPIDITGMSFPVVAGETWQFEFSGALGSSGSSGCRFQLTFPAGTMLATVLGSNSNTEEHHDVITVTGTDTVERFITYNTASLPDGQIMIKGTFVASANGTVQVKHKNHAAGVYNSTVFAGSYIEYQKL